MDQQLTTVVNIRYREPYDVYIGRPGKGQDGPWGNPFVIGRDGTREQVIAKYAEWLPTQPHLLVKLGELQGKRLGCFCSPAHGLTGQAPYICHGQILARWADRWTPERQAKAEQMLREQQTR